MASSNSSVGYIDQSSTLNASIKLIEAYEFVQVNTTTSTAVTATGSQTVTVASITNIAVDQILLIDSGSSQEYVTVTAISGSTFTAVFKSTHASGVAVSAKVQRQGCAIGDPTSLTSLAGVGAKSVQQPFSLQTQPFTDTGRSLLTLAADAQTIANTTETLIPFTLNLGGTATAAQTNYTATKTGRIQSILVTGVNTSNGLGLVLDYSVIRLRSNQSGAVTTSSALRASAVLGLAGSAGGAVPFSLGGEMEIAPGMTIGFTRQDSVASFIILSLAVIGYEF